MRRTWIVAVLVAAVTFGAGIAHFAEAPSLLTFCVATVALAGLAWIVAFATEQVGERFGPAVTGLLQSTLGNLPEFFIVVFALSAGEIVVARASILGSIFANALFVLGLVIFAGSVESSDGVMRFQQRLPKDNATLLLLASFLIVVLGISVSTGDKASHHVTAISIVGAVALLVTYGFWLFDYLRSDAPVDEQQARGPAIPLWVALALLAAAGVGAAFVADWFIDALSPAMEQIGVPKEFAGLVIVAIAGNAVENTTGVVLALEGRRGSRDLRRQELGRADRCVPVPGARARVADVRDAADVRDRAGLHRRLAADGALAVADHRRRRGDEVRRRRADLALRDPRRADVLRVRF